MQDELPQERVILGTLRTPDGDELDHWALHRTAKAIEVVGLITEQENYQRWFNDAAEPPRIAWFFHSGGTIFLSRRRYIRQQIRSSAIDVALGFDRAVLIQQRDEADYRSVSWMRTTLPQLRQWFHIPGISRTYTASGEFSVTAKRHDPMPLFDRLRFQAETLPQTVSQEDIDIHALKQEVFLTTHSDSPLRWGDHFHVHANLRDLVRVSSWTPADFASIAVKQTPDTEDVEARFAEVIELHRDPQVHGHSPHPTYLFDWKDINGAGGLQIWFDLMSRFGRGMRPSISTVSATSMPMEISVAQIAIGLDGIGYQLALDAGIPPNRAKREMHKRRLQRIWDECAVTPDLISRKEWSRLGERVYNAVKHANYKEASPQELLDVWQAHRLIFRIWVASRLKVSPEILSERLKHDDQNRRREIFE